MSVALIDLAFALVLAASGLLAGWWLRGAGSRPSPRVEEESRHAREVLGRLQDLAVRMAANVGQHSSRVEEINQELSAAEGQESELVVSAVTKLIQANQQMQQQLSTAEGKLQEQARLVETHAAEARTDALTGLANRRAFDDELARRFAESQRTGKVFSVIMGDIDHFKRFNDTHGHQAGDEVLRGVARVLRKTAREMDLVARHGGEEFAVILPETSVTDATKSLERIRRAVGAARFHAASVELRVTASFGVAAVLAGEEAADLVRRADAAMYAAKQAGRNRGHWHDGQATHAIAADEQSAAEKSLAAPPAATKGPAPVAATPPAPRPRGEATSGPAPTEPDAAQDARRERSKALCSRNEFCTHLGRRLAEWRRGGIPPAVLLVRIDDYQGIVARCGHQTASLALRATAQFLAAAVRDMDLAGQYEDAAFAMLLPGVAPASVIGVAERLRQAIARCALPVPGGPLRFTVSVAGAVIISSDETQTLLWRTEEALDAATKAGGNCSFFHNGQWSETAAAALERAT